VPKRCGACGGEFLEQAGFGTERVEADLKARFPGARIARVDRDTIRRKGAIVRVLAAVERGELDIVVGTQMIAKGHDFPAVTLVGVVSADVGLGLADFRASERTFQLLTQVVGRAGRGEQPGQAIIRRCIRITTPSRPARRRITTRSTRGKWNSARASGIHLRSP
jgi:primosomal protein N' (replication factor Y)